MRREIKAWLFILLTVTCVTACSNPTGQPPKPSEQEIAAISPGVPFTLKAGQQAALNVDQVVVSFVNIPEDSRCPSDVTCVWAGQVTAVLRVVVGGQALGDKSLTQMAGQPVSVAFNGYSLTLSAVNPYPISTTPIKPMDYEATLILSQ